MAPATIRPARIEDIDAIVTMLQEIHAQHLAWDVARWTTAEPPHTSYGDWIRELLDRPGDGVVLVAEVNGVVAGYTLAEVEAESTRHWSPRAVYVHDLFVAGEHRRRGVARSLMTALLVWCDRHHPGLQVRLITAASNEPARSFFATFGFRSCAVELIRAADEESRPRG